MKNSPERSFNDEFEKRIASYSEIPDDVVWKNIDKELRPNRMLFLLAWWDGATSVLLVSLFLGMFVSQQNHLYQPKHSHSVINVPMTTVPKKSEVSDQRIELRDVTPVYAVIPNKKHNSTSQIPDLELKQAAVSESFLASMVNDDSSKVKQIEGCQVRSLVAAEIFIEESMDSILHTEILEKDVNEKMIGKKSSSLLPLKNLKIYVAATPMLNFHQVVPIAGDGIGITGVESPSVLSSDRMNVSLSGGLQGHISPRFEYYGGITFFQKKTSFRYSLLSEEIVTELVPMNYSITLEHNISDLSYKTTNVGLHGGMLFHLYGKRLMHKVGAGLLYYKGFVESANDESSKDNHSSHLAYQLFYRNEIAINRRLKFFVQPTFTNSFYVDENLKGRPFKLRPYSAGIEFGAIFQLD